VVNRRQFLQSVGVAAAAGPSLRPLAAQGPATVAGAPDVVVVGAGAFGAWTALGLREAGARVMLLDMYGPGNSRATSGDETRQIRVGYGDREMYSRWAAVAMTRWEARQEEFGRRLLYRVGRLQLAPSWTPAFEATHAILGRMDVAIERLGVDEVRKRWPQIEPEDMAAALFEPGAAILRARESLMAVAQAFERKGGTLAIARAAPGPADGRRLTQVNTADGGHVSAGTFVFACGPWLRTLFPSLLGSTIDTPRREVFLFGPPPGDTRFTWPHLPNFSEASYYGFPDFDHRGVKVCPVGGVIDMDPDTDERVVTPHYVRRAHEYVARRFPGLRGQPVIETRVCQLENTADEHFVIDRHPDFDNVWVAGGGSGHGFKHGPVLGEHIARRVLGQPAVPGYDEHFRLAQPPG
jgi:sarcosine oxidase